MEELRDRLENVVDAHGPWTAMSIKLSDDVCTREPAVDHRLKRILQACSDAVGKPLAACRVLDLACLEGHYALEFARHGSEVVGAAYHGHIYGEHDATETQAQKAKKLWASLDNDSSFWFTEPSLLNLLARAGYSSAFEVLTPTMPGNLRDRKTYLVVKGRPVAVLTSGPTDRQPHVDIPEGANPRMDPSQVHRGRVFATAKRVLPQGVKDVIKPALRAIKVLPPEQTPAFQRDDARK